METGEEQGTARWLLGKVSEMRRLEGKWRIWSLISKKVHNWKEILFWVCVCVFVFDEAVYDPRSRLNKNKTPGDTLAME